MNELEMKVADAARARAQNIVQVLAWLKTQLREGDIPNEELLALHQELTDRWNAADDADVAAGQEAIDQLRAGKLSMAAREVIEQPLPFERSDLEKIRELRERIRNAWRAPERWQGDLDGTTPIARNEELEKAILDAPDDASRYLVYADWLNERSDPRGLLINHQRHPDRHDRHAASLLRRHERYFFGGLARYEWMYEPAVELSWKLGFIEHAKVMLLRTHEDAGMSQAEIVKTLRALPSAAFVRTLELGAPSIHEDGVADAVVDAVAQGGVWPTVRKLVLDCNQEEEMLSWTETGPLGRLWPVLPNLTSIEITAGIVDLGELALPRLAELRIETCGLVTANIRSITNANLPWLWMLELWFGDAERRSANSYALEDIAALLESDVLSNVTHLGLVNTTFTDEICALLAKSKVMQHVERLDLSRGTMTDAGAMTLSGMSAPHLRSIDVNDNYLTDEGIEALSEWDTISKEQRELEEYEGSTYRYCSVAE